MVAVAILWSWNRVAGTLLLAFWGITRPGEVLRTLRSDLWLPCDLLQLVCYLKIRAPKTGRRTKARVQRLSVHNADVLPFLEKVFGKLVASEALYPGSAASFRKRWDALLEALLIPRRLLLTPAGLRGSGAIAAYHRNVDLGTLQWQMRIRHQVSLQAYMQEVAAENLLLQLPSESVSRVKAAASEALGFSLRLGVLPQTAKCNKRARLPEALRFVLNGGLGESFCAIDLLLFRPTSACLPAFASLIRPTQESSALQDAFLHKTAQLSCLKAPSFLASREGSSCSFFHPSCQLSFSHTFCFERKSPCLTFW